MITINRNNYEHYFLLWVDGELSPEEMMAVERFIAEHPDLAEELSFLQDTKLVLEDQIIFTGKEQLLKQSINEISYTNYESWFLSFIDNELSIADRQKVELFVLQHPKLQGEFELLQSTKLVPEEWVFRNKETLYQQEDKKRPVLYMRWMRYAVAAAMIGLIATVWMIAPTNQLKNTIEMEGAQPEVVGTQPANTKDIVATSIEQSPKNSFGQIHSNQPVQTTASINNTVTEQPINGNNNLVASINNETVIKEEQATARIEQNTVETVKSFPTTNLIAGKNEIEINQGANIEPAETKTDAATEEVKPVYTALEDADEDKSLFIGALEINKDKLRGLFRKAGTIFRSKAKQEEDTRQQK